MLSGPAAQRPEPPSSGDRQRAFIAVLSQMPDLCRRLLAEHVPDQTGTRCVACSTAGTCSPGAAWPCRIHDIAESAQARRKAQHRPTGPRC